MSLFYFIYLFLNGIFLNFKYCSYNTKKRGERGGHAGSSDRELAAALTVKPVLTRALTGWQGGSLPPFCGGRGGQREAQAAADLCALGDVHSRHRMCDRKWKTNRHLLIFLPLVHLQKPCDFTWTF